MFKNTFYFLVAFITLMSLNACRESGSIVADHFEKMALIAEQNTTNCKTMAQELNQYYSANDAELEYHMLQKKSTTEVEARRINTASVRFEKALQACKDDHDIEAFKTKFAKIIMQQVNIK